MENFELRIHFLPDDDPSRTLSYSLCSKSSSSAWIFSLECPSSLRVNSKTTRSLISTPTTPYVLYFRYADQNEVPFGFWFLGNFEEMPMPNSDSDKVLKTRLFKRSPDMTEENNLLAQLRQILERRKNGDTGSHILPYPRLG